MSVDWTPELERARVKLCGALVDLADLNSEDRVLSASLREAEMALTLLGDLVTALTGSRPEGESRLVQFLYLLGRDALPLGAVQGLVERTNANPTVYSNRPLESWARDIVRQLLSGDRP